MNDSTLPSPVQINSDHVAIRNAVTAIRNAFMRADGRRLLIPGDRERRASVRVALRVPVFITPADFEQGAVHPHTGAGCAMEGVSQDISLGGLGLTHSSPLPGKCAVVRFDVPGNDFIDLTVEVIWSNRLEDGSWMSGTRILGLTEPAAGPFSREAQPSAAHERRHF
jgi:hypothetical protein